MRILNQQILCFALFGSLLSCQDEVDTPITGQQSQIEFETEQLELREDNSEGNTIKILLDRKAPAQGSIRVKIPDAMASRVETLPAHEEGILDLAIQRGEDQAQFKILPVDNEVKEANQVISLLLEASTGFVPGVQKNLQLTIVEDDGAGNPDAVNSTVSFDIQEANLAENASASGVYKLVFSPAVEVAGKVEISINASNTESFNTLPAVQNQKITLQVPVGATEVSFTLDPVNNSQLNGHQAVEFAIATIEGSLTKGEKDHLALTIKDDELVGKFKGYEVVGPESSLKKTYEYDTKGRIARIIEQSFAPHNPTTKTLTYFYDEQDQLVKVNHWVGRDQLFFWENGKMVRSEVYQDEVLIEYNNYAYDERGNFAGTEPFYKNQQGEFKRGLFSVYLYYTDGNIYKALTYSDSPNSDEPVLITTRTYENYTNKEAPISLFENLPHIRAQKQLAGTYRFEQHMADHDTFYQLSYEFGEDGKVTKRTASAPGDTQVTRYLYY